MIPFRDLAAPSNFALHAPGAGGGQRQNGRKAFSARA